jgi:hypothetical protein
MIFEFLDIESLWLIRQVSRIWREQSILCFSNNVE